MMNDKNIEALGLVLKNTYFITDYEPAKIGKMVMNLVKYFEQEEERDMREKANQAQYDEDWQSSKRDWAIAQNGNVGYD